MVIRIDTGSLKITDLIGSPGLFEVTADVTEGTAVNDWENKWYSVRVPANKNEAAADVLKRIRDEYTRIYKASIAAETFKTALLSALEKDLNAKEFTRTDPNPPKPEPMEVKLVTTDQEVTK